MDLARKAIELRALAESRKKEQAELELAAKEAETHAKAIDVSHVENSENPAAVAVHALYSAVVEIAKASGHHAHLDDTSVLGGWLQRARLAMGGMLEGAQGVVTHVEHAEHDVEAIVAKAVHGAEDAAHRVVSAVSDRLGKLEALLK
jgi:hypothetical protein